MAEQLLESVLQQMAAVGQRGGNAASLHQLGQAVRRDVDAAARAIAQRVGMPGAQVCFVSCVAHAHALALMALLEAASSQERTQGEALAAKHGARGALAATEPTAERPVAVLPRQDGPWALAAATLQAHGHVPVCPQASARAPANQAVLEGCETASVGEHVHLDATALCVAHPDRALIWPVDAVPASVAVGASALGGPLGIAALVAKGVPTRAGTVPRELVVGFGVAAAAGLQKLT